MAPGRSDDEDDEDDGGWDKPDIFLYVSRINQYMLSPLPEYIPGLKAVARILTKPANKGLVLRIARSRILVSTAIALQRRRMMSARWELKPNRPQATLRENQDDAHANRKPHREREEEEGESRQAVRRRSCISSEAMPKLVDARVLPHDVM